MNAEYTRQSRPCGDNCEACPVRNPSIDLVGGTALSTLRYELPAQFTIQERS